ARAVEAFGGRRLRLVDVPLEFMSERAALPGEVLKQRGQLRILHRVGGGLKLFVTVEVELNKVTQSTDHVPFEGDDLVHGINSLSARNAFAWGPFAGRPRARSPRLPVLGRQWRRLHALGFIAQSRRDPPRWSTPAISETTNRIRKITNSTCAMVAAPEA